MINYLSKFAPNLAKIIMFLRCLLAKDVEFPWNESQANAFKQIKEIFTRSPGPVFSYYDMTKPLTLQVNASKFGLRATLLQENKPIAYASKSPTPAEINFSQIKKEMFAILW